MLNYPTGADGVQAVKILHYPINAMLVHRQEKGVLDEDDTIRFYSPFGMFLFGVDEYDEWLLKTVIKADALEGEKRRDWETMISGKSWSRMIKTLYLLDR